MNQIKVMVGQIWVCNIYNDKKISSEVEFCCDDSVTVFHSNGQESTVASSSFHEYYTFVPANNLEWLAVNCNWDVSKSLTVTKVPGLIVRIAFSRCGGYTFKQWQNKRNELYGVEDKQVEQFVDIKVSVGSDKPVYTQAMADAGELPPVGCVAMGKSKTGGKWEQVKIIAHVAELDSCAVIRGKSTLFWCSHFKPIKTDEEKLVDDMCKVMEDARKGRGGYENQVIAILEEFNITRK